MSADELLAVPFEKDVASWTALSGPLPNQYRTEFRSHPSDAFDNLVMQPHVEPDMHLHSPPNPGGAPMRIGRPTIDRSHLRQLTTIRQIQGELLKQYSVDELIGRRPYSVNDINLLLAPRNCHVAKFDRSAVLRAYEAMCIENLGPTAAADRVVRVEELRTLLREPCKVPGAFASLEDVQLHLLALRPSRWASTLALEGLTKPGEILEGLPLFNRRGNAMSVDPTPTRARARANWPARAASSSARIDQASAPVNPVGPRSTTPARSPG